MNYLKQIRMFSHIAFLSLIFVSTNLSAQKAKLSDVKIEQYKLDNGLTVVLNEDHTKPEVFGVVVCKAGAKNDPADATGMAHYQEHLLFKGTQELGTKDWEKEKVYIDKIVELYEKLSQTKDEEKRNGIQKEINKVSVEAAKYAIPNEFSTIIKSMGGTNLNANTSDDRTVYFNKFPANQIEKWLELYSHRFEKPVFRLFQSELEVVYEEKNMANDQFITPLFEEFHKNFFKNHPYGQQTVIGTLEHLKNPPMKKMLEFYNTYYVANNMALILTGSFDSEKVKPLIEEKFGKWKTGEIPEFQKYDEKEFNGRVLIEKRLSPIKLGIMGFRTVPVNHPDELALELTNRILSNEGETGLFDKLYLDNKMLAAAVFPFPRNDMGQTLMFFVPKLIGQKLDKAENLLISELKKLQEGEFDDAMVKAQKKGVYIGWIKSFEEITSKGQIIAEAFQQGLSVDELLKYPEKINAVTKEDIIRVAKKYYGNNYLVLHSKMGFKKPERIKQPEFEPINTKTTDKSTFRKKLESMHADKLDVKYVDFEKDISKNTIKKGVDLYYTENPKNEIFNLKIRFGAGEEKLPLLKYASGLYNYAGTKEYNLKEIKNEFAKLGCSYNIYSDNSYLFVEIEGLDKSFEKAVILVNKLLNTPVIEDEKIDIIYEGEKAGRKFEKSEPDNVADALFDYVRFAEKSEYIDRLNLKQIKELKTGEMINVFKKATGFETEVFYTGIVKEPDVINILKKELKFPDNLTKSESPVHKQAKKYNENTVFFVDKKKASQSKIFFFINGKPFSVDNAADINAFNIYFGGGFSGLVLQEIREYRSMAYSAGAFYRTPEIAGKENYFMGYIGTQADKTLEAIDVFNELVRNMPQKTERIDFICEYLKLTALSNSPSFRNLNETVLKWKYKGYSGDPAKLNIPKYENLKFSDIVLFYEENIKDKPMVVVVVGSKKQFDYKKLSKYGKLKILDEKDLFSK